MIEICSLHKGKINVTTKDGRAVTADFRDVSGRGPANGLAEVDEAVAEALLEIGKPDYWKPGENGADIAPITSAKADVPDGGGEGGETKPLSLETYGELKNVNGLKTALAEFKDEDTLMQLIAQESQQETVRKSWMDALNERLEALQQA